MLVVVPVPLFVSSSSFIKTARLAKKLIAKSQPEKSQRCHHSDPDRPGPVSPGPRHHCGALQSPPRTWTASSLQSLTITAPHLDRVITSEPHNHRPAPGPRHHCEPHNHRPAPGPRHHCEPHNHRPAPGPVITASLTITAPHLDRATTSRASQSPPRTWTRHHCEPHNHRPAPGPATTAEPHNHRPAPGPRHH